MAAGHSAEILLPIFGIERHTHQFTIGQCDPVILCSLLETTHVVFTDLVPKSTRTTVNLDCDVVRIDLQVRSSGLVMYFRDSVHFDKMVPSAKSPEYRGAQC